MTTSRVLDKLSKLKASRDGEAKIGNSAAAEAFAEAINRLLIQHELSEVDIPVGGAEEPIVELLVNRDAYGIKRSNVRIGWQEALACIVAPAHLCKVIVSRGSNCITFVGTKSHVTVAEYAYGVLAAAADRMSKEARDAYWRRHRDDPDFESGNFRAAWLNGFIGRIDERFAEARRAEVAAASQHGTNSSTALIRLDQALVRAKNYVDEKYKKTIPGASMSSGCLQGLIEGRKAADAVKLGQRGVESGGKRPLLK